MHEFLKAFLDLVNKDVVLDQKTKNLIGNNCKPVRIRKSELLLNAGEICKDIYFMVDGRAISYFTDYDGKTKTWFFHHSQPGAPVKNLFAVDYRSFLSGVPSKMSIQTTSEVNAVKFSKEVVDLLIENSEIFAVWMRKLHERSLIVAYDRITTLLTLTATERYLKFLNDEAYLLDMFSNYHIATYLHVTPQSLSRIRKRVHLSVL
ncbi:Crp/Fnr family transcriptional regulator [Dyadobacter subterraneus]|uniref:Crp/Fnr family transcriptional regulator n=1 Tax=Dyadobacter subterraneus TaxID=2773304 RepID=A0ABR9WCR2_9BACT|nr:Crp/Fnr family transcriptional regulator [Dyadobacter subterraneus]MBE9463267.1 Crp/Fnr family transcriptional regulator [Dyadobacter subterraneus]